MHDLSGNLCCNLVISRFSVQGNRPPVVNQGDCVKVTGVGVWATMIKTPEALFARIRLSGRYVYGGNPILRSP